MSELEEHLATLPDEPAPAEAESAPEPVGASGAEAAPVEAGEPSQESESKYLLRDLLPADRLEKLPESLRNADLEALLEDRNKGWQERHHAGNEKNQVSESLKELQARVAAQDKILEFIKSQQSPQQQSQTKESDPFSELGFDPERSFYENPKEFFGKGIPGLTQKQIEAAMTGPQKDIEEIKAQLFWTSVRDTQQKARPEDVKPEIWSNEKVERRMHSFMQSNKLDPRNPESWKQAWDDYKAEIALFQPKPTSPTPAAQHANPPHAKGAPGDASQASDAIARPANMSKAEYAALLDMAKSMGLSKTATKQLIEGGPAKSYGPATANANGVIYG